MWLLLAFISALFLGSYEICKKLSVQNNAVIPVLLTSTLISSLILCPLVLISKFQPSWIEHSILYIPPIDIKTHLFIFLKSAIVLTSWIFAYFALKHLPLTLASPIKATQPIWTVLGAVIIFKEQLNGYQATGVGITLISFFMFSIAGKKDGISFRTNKWFWFIILATLTGAASGLYDKYLMRQFNLMAVLVYCSFYQTLLMAIITAILWWPTRKKTTPFQFRGSIILISVFLIIADFLYFNALSMPDSMISLISTIRRSGVIVPFLYGVFIMRDKNIKIKAFCLSGVILGMIFLFLGSQ